MKSGGVIKMVSGGAIKILPIKNKKEDQNG